MDIAEEKANLLSTKFLFLWLFILMAIGFSCQQDTDWLTPKPDDWGENELKAAKIGPGQFSGEYSGGEWMIKLPETWNFTEPRCLIVYAHGMVDPTPYEPVKLPEDSIGGDSVIDIVTGMYMGYAATSYRDNGLVILDAVEDVKHLVNIIDLFFKKNDDCLPPDYLFLGGPSEGGLVTVKTIEKYPELFDGAVSICGPVGSFGKQLPYNGDFHVLFNYFFGADLATYGVYLGNPSGVTPDAMAAWENKVLQSLILNVLSSHPAKVAELINCAKIPVDVTDPIAVGTAILELLRFNIMLTNDVIEQMNGVPYNNLETWYSGSSNDELLNSLVERIGDNTFVRAKNQLEKYETSGRIRMPLVAIHTIGDHVTPYWHATDYELKIQDEGNDYWFTGMPVPAYGHCAIEKTDIMAALAILVAKTASQNDFKIAEAAFKSDDQRNAFEQILSGNAISVDFK